MATNLTCPHCGKPVPESALGGICPECMLKAGVAAETGEVGPEGAAAPKRARSPAPTAAQLAPLFPQLEILECLGCGGMGAVYKARQPKLDRLVALKILTRTGEGGISDTEFAERFQREARALARLNHPDIVAVYDFGEVHSGAGVPPATVPAAVPAAEGPEKSDAPPAETAGGTAAGETPAPLPPVLHYLIMEYVDGLNLRQLLQARRLTPEEALGIVPKICAALQFAHERGIVHRDIKPENILLDTRGQVKIADFGIAKILGVTPDKEALTRARDVIGTPHYMAPEQIEKPQTVDHRADIYSLGVVFYEMLTGELPLGKFQPPSHKVRMDVRLDEVVLHALEKEPERRYQHASEVKSDVETIAASPKHKPSSARPATPVPALSRRWFAPLIVARGGRRVIHWPGVIQDSFLLAGIFCVAWLAMVTLLAPLIGTPHVASLIGGLIGFLIAMLAFGFYRSSRTPTERLLHLDAASPQVPAAASRKVDPEVSGLAAARWSARILGTLLLLFFGMFLIAEGVPPLASQPAGVQVNFIALALILLGFVVGWWRDGTAAVLIAVGWTLWHISEGGLYLNLFLAPLLVSALFAYCWWAAQGRKTGALATTAAALAIALVFGQLFVPINVHVSGKIVDAMTGQAVGDAQIFLRNPTDSPPQARSRADGSYNAYVSWYPRQRAMTIVAPGYQTANVNLPTRTFGQRRLRQDYQIVGAGGGGGGMFVGTTPPRFGKVIERVLYSVGTERPIKGEDLDNARQIELPAEIEKTSEDQFFHWSAANGIDLMAFAHKRSWALWASLKLAPAPAALWDNAQASDVRAALRTGEPGLKQIEPDVKEGFAVYGLDTNTPLPLTLAFETRAGSAGLMQITGFTDNPRGVKLRYKLLEAPAQAAKLNALPAPDRVRAMILFNDIEDFGHEFNAAFTSTNLAAARTGVNRLLSLLTNFNATVSGTGSEFPPGIFNDIARIRQALDDGNWDQARKLSRHNEDYARAFREIGRQIVALAREHSPEAVSAPAKPPRVPPVVVNTFPETGAADVDPALREIRVTFSEAMEDGSWSWVMWDAQQFPRTTGQPRYLSDQRTCVLPVQLEPGKVYAMWLNSETNHGFREQSGQPALPYLLIFQTRE